MFTVNTITRSFVSCHLSSRRLLSNTRQMPDMNVNREHGIPLRKLLQAPATMDESPLECYFDKYIANEEEKEEKEEDLFIRMLPDELLTLSSQDGTGSAEGTSLDYNSQNPPAAATEPTDGSSLPEPGTSTVSLTTTMTPNSLEAIIPQIQNVMATVKLGCRLDLNLIAHKAWNVEYKPETYKALIMRIRRPRATALLYTSGNMVCSGAKSVEESLLSARKCTRRLQRLGFPVSLRKFKVHNIVASCSIFPVCLERLHLAHHERCSYEAELFPGLFYRVTPGINATIFPSGKINICGAQRVAEVHKAFDTIYPILSVFRRT